VWTGAIVELVLVALRLRIVCHVRQRQYLGVGRVAKRRLLVARGAVDTGRVWHPATTPDHRCDRRAINATATTTHSTIVIGPDTRMDRSHSDSVSARRTCSSASDPGSTGMTAGAVFGRCAGTHA
jgi:hypothetical protein